MYFIVASKEWKKITPRGGARLSKIAQGVESDSCEKEEITYSVKFPCKRGCPLAFVACVDDEEHSRERNGQEFSRRKKESGFFMVIFGDIGERASSGRFWDAFMPSSRVIARPKLAEMPRLVQWFGRRRVYR
jgi:hypothetical protein